MNRLLPAMFLLAAAVPTSAAEPTPKTENILLVMFDGIRWQEAFTGADEGLINKERGGVANVAEMKKRFLRDTAKERREALMPFLWNTIAREGQLFGNHETKSVGVVTNKLNFSYPGYNEVLCGFPDPKVNSNAKVNNRNVTVLEWLHRKPEFKNRIAAFTSWEVFPFIINAERSGIPVNSGMMPLKEIDETPEVRILNRLIADAPLEGEETRADAFTFHAAMLYLKTKKPRVLFLSFDETDTQAHNGRYDRVLASAYKVDQFVKELWETVQSMPEYKGKTTLILTTDHGRGDAPVEWKSHNARIKGAEYWWVGVLGPDTPALGERKDLEPVKQNQVAATVAALLGLDYNADVSQAGPPLPDVIRGRK